VIELDLSGHKLSVTESDLEWLRIRAEKAAGSSSPSSELAARLAAITTGQRRLVFVRAEVRGLLNALSPDSDLPPGLVPLSRLLQEMFAPKGPATPPDTPPRTLD
jgi:hypothetical protein